MLRPGGTRDALPHKFKRIRLNLARSKEFPQGSSQHGYEFVAPLDADGHIDVEAMAKQSRSLPRAPVLRRRGRRDGFLVHKPGGPEHGAGYSTTTRSARTTTKAAIDSARTSSAPANTSRSATRTARCTPIGGLGRAGDLTANMRFARIEPGMATIDRKRRAGRVRATAVTAANQGRSDVLIDHRTYTSSRAPCRRSSSSTASSAIRCSCATWASRIYYLMAESGELNTIVHGWVYESAADREQKRAQHGAGSGLEEISLAENAKAGNIVEQTHRADDAGAVRADRIPMPKRSCAKSEKRGAQVDARQ